MMTKINRTRRTARLSLSLSDSVIWAGRATPDGRALDEVRRRVLAEVAAVATSIGASIEVYSCQRHGGCLLEVVEP